MSLNSSFSIQVHDYESSQDISKQQIILNKNTFSFLQQGTKEVFFDNSSYSINNTQFLLMKSGHCLMTEKLSNDKKNYRSILFFFSNEATLKFIRKFELNESSSKAYVSTYSFNYDSFIKRFVESILDISKTFKTKSKKYFRC